MKKIDIIIPAYNAHNTLNKTLTSIALQSMVEDIRVILIDDCSDKDYKDIVKNFSDKLDILLIRNEQNKGCGVTRNIGLDNVDAEFIMFVDADDRFYDSNSVEHLYNAINEESNINAVYASFNEIDKENKVFRTANPMHWTWIFSAIFRTSFINKFPIRFADASSGEDCGFNKKIKMLSKMEEVKFIEDICYLWTDDNENRINAKDDFTYFEGRQGFINALNESYEVLEQIEEFSNLPFEYKKLDYLSNLITTYFLSILIDSYNHPSKNRSLLMEPFKIYYNKYAPIFNKSITKEEYELSYDLTYKNCFEFEQPPINPISFEEFLNELGGGYGIFSFKDIKPTLSIIIPIYHCENTIERLLNSILNQGIPKHTYEVIITDDGDSNQIEGILYNYSDNMNIRYCKNNKKPCPANNRNNGLKNARGKWVTFIDQDDVFTTDILPNILNLIREYQVKNVCLTMFKEYDIEKMNFTNKYYDFDIFLHGKFYNKDFLERNHIEFVEDVEAHEDIGFNNQVFAAVLKEGSMNELIYYNLLGYLWIYNKNSLSHRTYSHCYVDEYFEELFETITPIFRYYNIDDTRNFCIYKIMHCIIKAYLYYQHLLFTSKDKNIINKNYILLKNFIQKVKEYTDIIEQDIINYVSNNEKMYEEIKIGCISDTSDFTEQISFSDFINKLSESL